MTIKQVVYKYTDFAGNVITNQDSITENIIPSGGRCIKLGIQAPRDTIFKMLPYTPGTYESDLAQRFLIGPSEIYELSDCSIGYLEFVVQQDTNGEDISLKNIIIDMIIEEGGNTNE